MYIDLEAIECRLADTEVIYEQHGVSMYRQQADDMAALIAYAKTLESEKVIWNILHDAEIDQTLSARRHAAEATCRAARAGTEIRDLKAELAETKAIASEFGVLVLTSVLDK